MSCACWDCRRRWPLRRVAPRLARAYDLSLVEAARVRKVERELQKMRHLLAHRDLQYLRACMTGNPKYVKYRAKKLDATRRSIARLEGQLA